ncbi:MAG: pantoate--beta-alanine ligase [Bacteroidetes bacterium]|nr:pantoate--beta-alanine ligase [Bacteroidota bacterium]
MLLFKSVVEINRFLSQFRQNGRRVGFVPTMGALHKGHLDLLQSSQQNNDLTVCSIFVNPTQFNESSDLEKYPRREAADIKLLLGIGCDVLFMPPVSEMYPETYAGPPAFDFKGLEEPMEGTHRPGHFEGVAQVIHRFIEILEPGSIVMGQKDLQQYLIVRSMIRQLDVEVDLILHPIVREESGLAMSSRNRRLSPEEKAEAAGIHQILQAAKSWKASGFHPNEIQDRGMKALLKNPHFKPEYFDVVDTETLKPVERFKKDQEVAVCTAVWVGPVRLIDNILI